MLRFYSIQLLKFILFLRLRVKNTRRFNGKRCVIYQLLQTGRIDHGEFKTVTSTTNVNRKQRCGHPNQKYVLISPKIW